MSGSFSAPLSVLIIDDDPHFLAAYTVLLEEKFQVYTATTGGAGLAHLQRERLICSSSTLTSHAAPGDARCPAGAGGGGGARVAPGAGG